MKKILGFLLILGMASGCVSAQKFKNLESEHQAQAEELQKAKSQINEMNVVINDLQNRLGTTTQDKSKLQSSVDEMRLAMAEMSKKREETEKRVQEYRDLMRRFKSLIDTGKLSVRMVDGRMVVVLGSDILFASGSADLSDAGRGHISEITKVLRDIPNRKYQIEGHTDSAPIKTARFPSNWELAAGRAVSVVNTMIETGLPKERVSAASFADSRPVANNSTAQGKQANRRIEIVVVPDLSQMPGFDELNKMSQGQQK